MRRSTLTAPRRAAPRPIATERLVRAGAAAGMVAALLRIPASFTSGDDPGALVEALYLVIDVGLLLTLLAFLAGDPTSRTPLGVTGFVVAAVSTGLLIGPEPTDTSVDLYQVGASGVVAGLCLLALAWRRSPQLRHPALLGYPLTVALAGVTFAGSGLVFAATLLWTCVAVRRAASPTGGVRPLRLVPASPPR